MQRWAAWHAQEMILVTFITSMGLATDCPDMHDAPASISFVPSPIGAGALLAAIASPRRAIPLMRVGHNTGRKLFADISRSSQTVGETHFEKMGSGSPSLKSCSRVRAVCWMDIGVSQSMMSDCKIY